MTSNNAEALVFPNRKGQRLFGTWHTPERASSLAPVIVLLSPGVKMRVGPHRLYDRMTKSFNALGYTVFKFDFVGLGDSEGELDRQLLAEVYNDTETGAFVDDAVDALDFLETRFGVTSFIAGGLCGGAITGLLLASRDQRVSGLLSLGMTVTLAMGAHERMKFASQGELASLRKGYWRRLLQPKSWLRLVTFQSDFSTIVRSLAQPFGGNTPAKAKAQTHVEKKPELATTNANPLFPPAFFKLANEGRKILLVFSQSDRLFWDFEEKFAQYYRSELDAVSGSYELHVVENANHVFSFREWEDQMQNLVNRWLRGNFPRQGARNS